MSRLQRIGLTLGLLAAVTLCCGSAHPVAANEWLSFDYGTGYVLYCEFDDQGHEIGCFPIFYRPLDNASQGPLDNATLRDQLREDGVPLATE